MKDTITQRLDEKDVEHVDILKRIGFSECTAEVIVALISGEKTQHELAGCTGQSQSSISVVLGKLTNAGYAIIPESISYNAKGRPTKIYKLISWDTIVDGIEGKINQEYQKNITCVNKLKEFKG